VQPHLRDGFIARVQPERAIARGHLIGRARVEPHRDDGAAQVIWPARQRDLLRRAPLLLLVELSHRRHVEGEDEVALGLMLAPWLAIRANWTHQRARRKPHAQP